MQHVPLKLATMINGYEWKQITIGMSDASTYLLAGEENIYLKIQPLSKESPLYDEKIKLEWLQGRLDVPEVLYYGRGEYKEFLLMTEIKGINASDETHKKNVEHLMKLLAQGLREIHSVSIDNCPFQQTLYVKILEAGLRVEQQLVDEDDFDDIRAGQKAEELYQELLKKRPVEEDLVFTHGDYCLPNIIINGNSIGGFIDMGRAGIADRYQDIALAVRSITYNFGETFVPIFLEEYGLSEPDYSKIYYYQLLDEFF